MARIEVVFSAPATDPSHPEWTGMGFRYCSFCRAFLGFKSFPSDQDGALTHGICDPCSNRLRGKR